MCLMDVWSSKYDHLRSLGRSVVRSPVRPLARSPARPLGRLPAARSLTRSPVRPPARPSGRPCVRPRTRPHSVVLRTNRVARTNMFCTYRGTAGTYLTWGDGICMYYGHNTGWPRFGSVRVVSDIPAVQAVQAVQAVRVRRFRLFRSNILTVRKSSC